MGAPTVFSRFPQWGLFSQEIDTRDGLSRLLTVHYCTSLTVFVVRELQALYTSFTNRQIERKKTGVSLLTSDHH